MNFNALNESFENKYGLNDAEDIYENKAIETEDTTEKLCENLESESEPECEE